MARYLTITDLDSLVGRARVEQYFDDDLSGDLAEESTELDDVLTAAENEADKHLKRSFSDDQIDTLIDNDKSLRRDVAWVALEFATERRPEFCQPDGKGAFWAQYERSVESFKALGKGNARSRGESAAGKSTRIGGTVQPRVSRSVPRFIFAPDRDHPRGHGDF
jgi:hypothetical protein